MRSLFYRTCLSSRRKYVASILLGGVRPSTRRSDDGPGRLGLQVRQLMALEGFIHIEPYYAKKGRIPPPPRRKVRGSTPS
jgi:hypothetical protein